jgi:hypothetical protein
VVGTCDTALERFWKMLLEQRDKEVKKYALSSRYVAAYAQIVMYSLQQDFRPSHICNPVLPSQTPTRSEYRGLTGDFDELPQSGMTRRRDAARQA